MKEQPGDVPRPVFSYLGSHDDQPEQVCCWITHTNERTHDIIRAGLDRSPLFSGVIEGVGPRYCPSVEDKVHRFADKDSHQVFVEPEGLTTDVVYPNGISTSGKYSTPRPSAKNATYTTSSNPVTPATLRHGRFRDLRSSLM